MDEACNIEEHIDGPDFAGKSLDRARVQYIELVQGDILAIFQLRKLLDVDIASDHFRPLAGEGFSAGPADALCRRRDKSLFTLKPAGHAFLLCGPFCICVMDKHRNTDLEPQISQT